MANELTYEDYKRRISIRDILMDAGYSYNRRDGMRYPTYSRRDDEGKNIKGDKFIITANGLCCFQPPEHRNYNIISFIKTHPELFKEYTPGMNLDHLVNQVCCRLLNEPIIRNRKEDLPAPSTNVEHKEFNLRNFSLHQWKTEDFETQKPFYPFFSDRGINRETQRTFSEYFYITAKAGASKTAVRNLSFPMRIPGTARVVGLEMRGAPDRNGETFKGMALNTDATHGMWVASPALDVNVASELRKARNVFWFESAYDAMAFYQLQPDKRELAKAVFVSTGGSPSIQQFYGMLKHTDKANHHLCFDNDMAGRMYAINFAVARSGKDFSTHIATVADEDAGIAKTGQLVVTDKAENGQRFVLNMEPFDYGRLSTILDVGKPDMKAFLDSLKDKNDMKSGNYELLPADSFSGRLFQEMAERGIGPTEKSDIGKQFVPALFRDLQAYHSPGGCTIYEPCDQRFKDYNDQLLNRPMQEQKPLDKKQMVSENIVESSIDGTDGIYMEIYSPHEEEEEREEEERKGYLRR